MINKKLYKILIIMLLFTIIFSFNGNISFAKIDTNVTIPDTHEKDFEDIGNSVVGGLRVIGIFVFVAMLMVVGIKYMFVSVDQKAEYKKTAIKIVIGAFLIFASVGIMDIINQIFNP